MPGITDTDIPGNPAMTWKAKTAKHRREKEEKYRFYFNIPQRMFIVEATAVTASLPLQKRKDLCTTFRSLSLLRYDYIVTSSLSDKTDLISNFRIADLPGITDTKTPGNSAMTWKATTAKHRREKEEKYRFYFNIPQRMFIVEATAVTASLPLQKRKFYVQLSERMLLRYVYIVTSSLSDKTD